MMERCRRDRHERSLFLFGKKGRLWGKGAKSIFTVDTNSRESIRFSRTPVPMFWDLLPFFCRLILSRYCARECAPPSPSSGRGIRRYQGPRASLSDFYIYMNERTRGRTCLTRVSVAHGAAVPRAFLTARLPVFVSRVQEISAEERRKLKRRNGEASERKKERAF